MELFYINKKYFDALLSLELKPQQKSKLFSDLCRINILYMINKAGSGHVGSSFSSIDLMSWIFLEYVTKDSSNYFFSSKGHDAPAMYNVMISTGQLDASMLHKLRRVDGLPGHPDISTPNIVTNTGSLGMGISKAKGLIKANRLKNKACKVFVMTGDGELQEGQIWESLNRLRQEKMKELTIIVDHNKFQSDRKISTTSDLGSLEKKFESFGLKTITCDGNNVDEFTSSLNALIATEEPGVLISNTVKGSGVKYMESESLSDKDFYQFHSGAVNQDIYEKSVKELVNNIKDFIQKESINYLFELTTEKISSTSFNKEFRTQSLIKTYSKALIEEAKNNEKIVALDGDLILDTGLIEFEKLFPERFFECGIAEQDMVSQAGALALEGFTPIVHSFSSFLTSRPNEQIYNNATEKTKIIYIGSLAGLLPGGPGHSHQAVRDIASLSGIPNLEMIQPSNESETTLTLKYALNDTANNVYVRLCSIPVEIPFEYPSNHKMEKGVGSVISEGEEIVILSYGPVLLTEIWLSKKILSKSGVNPKIIAFPWLNQFSTEWVKDQLDNYKTIITVDDHYVEGGFGEKFIANYIRSSENYNGKEIFSLGVNGIPVSGTNQEVLKHHKLSSHEIAKTVLSLIKR